MDTYFNKLDEINESLDQLLKERTFLKKDLSVSPENTMIFRLLMTVWTKLIRLIYF